MKRLLFLLPVLAVLASTGHFAAREMEADPGKDYHVFPELGPWMVCIHSYTTGPTADPTAAPGPDPAQMAHDLVLELRSKYQLPAFIFNRGQEERKKQQQEIAETRKLCPEARVRIVRIEEQFAVLVGGYKDMDTAHKALEDIKKLKPPSDRFCILGERVVPGDCKGEKGNWIQQIKISPFANAFVAHNPTVPFEQPKEEGPDPFLKTLNRNESLSLLKNPKPWTLAVKSFRGIGMMQAAQSSSSNSLLDALGLGNKGGETLNAGAMQAHEMAELLRKMNFEAYVLHTRNNSVVCVGGFDSQNDPRLFQMQQTMSKLRFQCPRPDMDMQLMAQPLPMEVPHVR